MSDVKVLEEKVTALENELAEKNAIVENTESEKDDVKKAKGEAKKLKAEIKKLHTAIKREKNRMPEQNGVRRPRAGTQCGRVWEIADEISKKTGGPAAIANIFEVSRAEGLNDGNVRAEYARWRKFNGVTGRIKAVK